MISANITFELSISTLTLNIDLMLNLFLSLFKFIIGVVIILVIELLFRPISLKILNHFDTILQIDQWLPCISCLRVSFPFYEISHLTTKFLFIKNTFYFIQVNITFSLLAAVGLILFFFFFLFLFIIRNIL